MTVTDAVLTGAAADELSRSPLPEDYLAVHLRAEDVGMFRGVEDKDVRKSLHLGRVPMPELAPDEVVVALMASAVNYNTVWSAMFEPIPTFRFLKQFARQGGWEARHDLPYHVVGSDGSGVIVRVGSGVRRWRAGDHVIVSPVHVDEQQPATHAEGMMGDQMRAWGFETNFGGLAEYTVARASQLIAKPPHLTWEEAACNALCGGTAYRMLVSDNGARMKQGDVVLIWGAAGGLGGYAVQFVKSGGGVAVGVVSSPAKAEAIRRLGCDVVIDRSEFGIGDQAAGEGKASGAAGEGKGKAGRAGGPDEVVSAGRKLGALIRDRAGRDPRIVFDHTGRATFGISTYVADRGGIVVTCGSSTGYQHTYDNRHLWMRLKRVIGSHGANLAEQRELAWLLTLGRVAPTISAVYQLTEAAEAVRLVQTNKHIGKVAVLCLAPAPGLGVTDPALRARIGEDGLHPLLGGASAS